MLLSPRHPKFMSSSVPKGRWHSRPITHCSTSLTAVGNLYRSMPTLPNRSRPRCSMNGLPFASMNTRLWLLPRYNQYLWNLTCYQQGTPHIACYPHGHPQRVSPSPPGLFNQGVLLLEGYDDVPIRYERHWYNALSTQPFLHP